MVIPSRCTVSSGMQQSSICSWNIRHDPFQTRRGSIASELSTIATLASPQYAGSSCVRYCSISEKNPWSTQASEPASERAFGSFRPGVQNEMDGWRSRQRWSGEVGHLFLHRHRCCRSVTARSPSSTHIELRIMECVGLRVSRFASGRVWQFRRGTGARTGADHDGASAVHSAIVQTDARCWTLDAGRWTLDARRWILDPRRSTFDARRSTRTMLLPRASLKISCPRGDENATPVGGRTRL